MAGLSDYVPDHCRIILVDPSPAIESSKRITVIAEAATTGMQKVEAQLA